MATSRFPVLRGTDTQQSRVQDNVQSVLGPVAQALQATPIMGAAQPAWTNVQLLNGFAVPATGYRPAWQIDCIGRVHVRGRASHAAGAGALTLAFTLPLEARPGGTHLFPSAGVAAVQNVVVEATGAVTILNALAAGSEMSFEFSFQAGG